MAGGAGSAHLAGVGGLSSLDNKKCFTSVVDSMLFIFKRGPKGTILYSIVGIQLVYSWYRINNLTEASLLQNSFIRKLSATFIWSTCNLLLIWFVLFH